MSRQDLAEIVERASTVDERLGDDFVPGEDSDPAVVDARLEAWCQSTGNGDWDRLARRLAWDGLDLSSVRRALGPVRRRDAATLPEWSAIVGQALHLPPVREQEGTQAGGSAVLRFLDADRPAPFEEILVPFVLVARERLAGRAPACEQLLAEAALAALERSLLRSLSFASEELLLAQFETMRAQEQSSWDRLFALAREPGGRSLYRQFVRRMQDGGLAHLFREYPVLARSLGTIAALWVDTQAEFLGRLAADAGELERFFGEAGEQFGKIVELEPSLSDPHNGGRSVVALTFASGRKLVYKPKDMGTEAAYQRLLAWLNDQGAPLAFKVLKVVDRSTYGWVEFVEHLPCRDRDAARRYYQRAGMLLCLFYVLEVTDCHYENIIASGEFPVLVDAETLMHHRAGTPIPADDNARTDAFELIGHSVLRSGMLPRWELTADRRRAFHLSGLGEADEQEMPVRVPRWERTNTDEMALESAEPMPTVRGNVPRLDDGPVSLQEHSPQLVDGFRQLYEFLLGRRDALLASAPLRELAGEQVRYVFRPTGIYAQILRGLRQGRFLRDGADWSIRLEQLGRLHVPPRRLIDQPDEKPLFWPVFAAERQAMQRNDVPFFTARADSDAMIVSPGQEVRCFQEPSFELVVDLIERLCPDDLERQVAYIEGSMYTHMARETIASGPATAADEADDDGSAGPSREAFVASALTLADAIRSRAIRAQDGSASWIAPQLLAQAGRYQLQPMNFDLYSGTGGVALFLAAAERFAPGAGFGELALAAIRPLRRQLDRRPDRLAEMMGIGGAAGLGSIAYSMLRVGRLLDEPELLDVARRAAVLLTEDLIAADQALDVIGGAAGAVLGLLALHEARPDQAVLERAIACGEHLLRTRVATESGHRAWATVEQLRTTGFSHGAAGIAYALLRLYEHTRDIRLLEAANEAIAYEDAQYSPDHRNWVEYSETGEPRYLSQWCRGASGIGLARLAGLHVLDTSRIREDIEFALQATREHGMQGVDQPCCGHLGRAEVLLSAGLRLSRPELTEAARVTAWRAVTRAERTGGFVLHPRLPKRVDAPGFFQGTAGIGYELLRMDHADQLPSVLMWE